MASENPIVMNLQGSYGAFLMGNFFSTVLWGVSCMQLFLYYYTYDADSWTLKLFVFFMWAVDTANEIIVVKSMWPVLILHWASVAELSKFQPEQIHHGWVAGIVAAGVEMFFLWRIYIFSGKKRLIWVLLPFVWWQFIGPIPFAVLVLTGSSMAVIEEPRIEAFELSVRACSALVDIVIAASMIYLLTKRSPADFSHTKKLVYRIILVTINTGLWTAIISIAQLSLTVKFPDGFVWCILEFPLSPLYVNTLLANLNARRYLKGEESEFHSLFVSLPLEMTSSLPMGALKPEQTRKRSSTVLNMPSIINAGASQDHSTNGDCSKASPMFQDVGGILDHPQHYHSPNPVQDIDLQSV